MCSSQIVVNTPGSYYSHKWVHLRIRWVHLPFWWVQIGCKINERVCNSTPSFRFYYHFYYQILHKFLLLSPIKYYHKVWCGGAKKLQFLFLLVCNYNSDYRYDKSKRCKSHKDKFKSMHHSSCDS